jgi:hypothetical protein
MPVSQSALINRVRDSLEDFPFATQGSASTATSVVAVTDGTDWEEGAIGEFQDDGEQFKVISVSANNLTAFRGWNGTTGASHAASTTIIRDPTFSYRQVNQALSWTLNRLWPYAWKSETVTLTYDATETWYNFAPTGTPVGIIAIQQRHGGSQEFVSRFGVDGGKPFLYRNDLPTGLVTSGRGIRFPAGYYSDQNIEVRTAVLITGTSDIEDTAELPVADTMVLGAVAHLMRGKQVRRSTQGINRDEATTVSNLAPLQAHVVFEEQFADALQMLRIKHEMRYPLIAKWG